MFINIATCFVHNFGHHQALNEYCQVIKHIGYNTDPYLLTDYCVANILWEYITKLQLWLKGAENIHKVTNMLKIVVETCIYIGKHKYILH
jgi:hypothetical protein